MKIITTNALLIACALGASTGFAASDGTLGTTSTGTVDVSLTIPSLVQISGLSDIALGTATGVDADGFTTACIFTNVVAGTYDITATSANALAGAFRLSDGTTNFITYTATWNDENAAGGTALTSGTTLSAQTGANILLTNCGGTPNARFSVSVPAANYAAAPAGAYTDTVTLLVEPV